MITSIVRKRIVTAVIGAAIAGVAAPAFMFLGEGTAQAVGDVDGRHTTTSTTQRAPGHISIQVEPPVVSAPIVWGGHDSPIYVVGD